MDFTLKKYRELLESLKAKGYEVITFKQYCMGEYSQKIVILSHDVDLLPYNSLKTADIEHSLQIKGSYYFRAIKESWDETVVKEIDAFSSTLDKLNKIISDDNLLEEEYDKWATKKAKRMISRLNAFGNKYFDKLYKRGWLGNLHSTQRLYFIKDLLYCESHLDVIRRILKLNIKK